MYLDNIEFFELFVKLMFIFISKVIKKLLPGTQDNFYITLVSWMASIAKMPPRWPDTV